MIRQDTLTHWSRLDQLMDGLLDEQPGHAAMGPRSVRWNEAIFTTTQLLIELHRECADEEIREASRAGLVPGYAAAVAPASGGNADDHLVSVGQSDPVPNQPGQLPASE